MCVAHDQYLLLNKKISKTIANNSFKFRTLNHFKQVYLWYLYLATDQTMVTERI